jgi:Rod binding domain-containing protein
MDEAKLILTQPVLPPVPLDYFSGASSCKEVVNRHPDKIDNVSEGKKKQAAKDFESILLGQLLDEMKNTIGHLGFDEDGASEQIQGIFWLYLARDMANNGGIGLWKDIYRFLTNADQANTATNSVDGQI